MRRRTPWGMGLNEYDHRTGGSGASVYLGRGGGWMNMAVPPSAGNTYLPVLDRAGWLEEKAGVGVNEDMEDVEAMVET